MRRLGFGLLLAVVVGCGSEPPPGPPRVKAEGKCFAAGNKPAAGAVLVFHRTGAAAGELPPRAKVGADGTFAVTSADGDGLPEGEYVVTVEWRTGEGENDAPGRSLVADKFTRSNSTPLKATVRATDGGCTLPTYALSN